MLGSELSLSLSLSLCPSSLSPPQILNGLKTALQRQYDEFMRRHPHFLSNGGTVSVIAHSLGSVMLYDILREKCELDPKVSASLRSSSSTSTSRMSSCGGAVGGAGSEPAISTSSSALGGGRGQGVGFTIGDSMTSMEGVDGEGRVYQWMK